MVGVIVAATALLGYAGDGFVGIEGGKADVGVGDAHGLNRNVRVKYLTKFMAKDINKFIVPLL
jgi:hypothetical protein